MTVHVYRVVVRITRYSKKVEPTRMVFMNQRYPVSIQKIMEIKYTKLWYFFLDFLLSLFPLPAP